VKWWSFDTMGQIFVLLASCAAFDVLRDPCSCAGPEVFFIYLPDRFVPSGVSAKWPIMPGMHKFVFQSLVRGNDETVCFGISPEWSVWVIYSFNGEDAFPFFHECVMGVLDDRDRVF
jgi:hypothetical protein